MLSRFSDKWTFVNADFSRGQTPFLLLNQQWQSSYEQQVHYKC